MSRKTKWVSLAASVAIACGGFAATPPVLAAPATPSEGAASSTAPVEAAPAPLVEQFTGRVIVKFADGSVGARTPLAAGQRADQIGSAVTDSELDVVKRERGMAVLEGAAPEEAPAVAAAIEKQADVEYASPEQVFQYYPAAPANITGPNLGATGTGIDRDGAWTKSRGAGVTVGVLDSGVVLNHEAFSGRMMAGADLTTSDDHDATPGRDMDPTEPVVPSGATCSNGAVPKQSWHGTHVAGIVAAVAPDAQILPVRVGGHCNIAGLDMIDGIKWAAGLNVNGVTANANKADVINLSLGSPGACQPYLQDAINQATAAGVTVVTAAGNDSSGAAYSPASCANVLNVAAIDGSGNRASFSNYGASVRVSAPGVAITSAVGPNANSYAQKLGTSMAAPHVAGIAALVKAHKSALTPAQVISSIVSSTKPTGGTCNGCGSGRVNAPAALLAAENGGSGLVVTAVVPQAGKVAGGDTITITGAGLSKATAVSFGAKQIKLTAKMKTDTTITVKAPKAAVSTGVSLVDVKIISPQAATIANTQYRYAPVPAVKSYAPKTLTPDGGPLVITGVNFAPDAAVTFNGQVVNVTAASPTAVTVTAPPNVTTSKAVVSVVVTANDIASRAGKLTYAVPRNRIKSASKKIPAAGAPVVLTGNDLDKVTEVKLNGAALPTAAWRLVAADSSLAVTVPAVEFKAKPAAKLTVTNKWNLTSNAVSLIYDIPKIALKAPRAVLTPDGGAAVFTGTNLDKITSVKLGADVLAADQWSLNGAKTEFTVQIPAQAQTTRSVAVTAASPYFEARPVAARVAVPKSRITVTPNTVAAAGGQVTVSGTFLDKVTAVSVNGVDLAAGAWSLAAGGASIAVTVPARASGAKASVAIVATNKWGTKSNAASVKYLP